METRGAENFHHYGLQTTDLINEVFASGVNRAVILMRHSARTFNPDIHDLLNPLTDHGRNLSRRLGQALPREVQVRGYASPAERCLETARLIIDAHQAEGGIGGRTRAVEAFGPFYALDQQKMWKGLTAANGLPDYIRRWFDDEVPADAMMPAELAVQMVLRAMHGKLSDSGVEEGVRHLDICVSHDMTVYTVRHGLGLEPLSGPDVEFLDGLLMFQRDDQLFVRSQHGAEIQVRE